MIKIKNVAFPYKGKLVYGDIGINDNIFVEFNLKDKSCWNGNFVIPGFIDTHTHGYRGLNSETLDVDAYLAGYLERGITSVCPTIGPRKLEYYEKIIENYSKTQTFRKARYLGVHLEGPFLNKEKSGAINPDTIYDIDKQKVYEFIEKNGKNIKQITIAPELLNIDFLIELAVKHNIIISAGHTQATYKDMKKAFDLGLNSVTHMFNAMPNLDHRNESMLDFIIENKINSEIICDGNHINYHTLQWFIRMIGVENVRAISDGGKTCGFDFPDGFITEEGKVYKKALYENGKLAGSTFDLYDAFKMLVLDLNFSIPEASSIVSGNAGLLCGIKSGKIEKGYFADYIILDNKLNIQCVIVDGK